MGKTRQCRREHWRSNPQVINTKSYMVHSSVIVHPMLCSEKKFRSNIYQLHSSGQSEDVNGRTNYSRANKNGMMCYIKIKLTKSIQETAEIPQAPETEKKCTIPRLPSNPTQTRNVLPRNQRKRKPSPVRRSPRKKKAVISLVEDAPEVQSSDAPEVQSLDATEVQSSDSEFSHIKALLSAPVTSSHDVKGCMATANHSAENRSTTKIAQTELTSTPENFVLDSRQ